jgi:hypothetical protein
MVSMMSCLFCRPSMSLDQEFLSKVSSEDWADCWGTRWLNNSADAHDTEQGQVCDLSQFHFSASLDENHALNNAAMKAKFGKVSTVAEISAFD